MGDLPIVFTGEAPDAEDGPLSGERPVGASDRDGFLGEGNELAVAALSPGAHRITLRATDQDGQAAEAALRVTVRGGGLYLPLVLRGS